MQEELLCNYKYMYKKVENAENLIKDDKLGAVIDIDIDASIKYKRLKQEKKKAANRINNIEARIDNIEIMLEKILSLITKD
jgi:hypothetical protein